MRGRVLATVIVGALIAVAVWTLGRQSPADQPPTPPPLVPAAPPTAIGTTVRDGGLVFTVIGYECGRSELGSPPVRIRAAGQFCLLDVIVHNAARYPGWVLPAGQRLIDNQGAQHTAHSWAWIHHKPARDLLRPLGPDDTVTGDLVFDIPIGSDPSLLIVHDTPLSRGTPLPLIWGRS